jgi:tetratricopeptide (TPR) repeat protein
MEVKMVLGQVGEYGGGETNAVGAVLIQMGELDEALGLYESLLAQNPQMVNIHQNMAVLYWKKNDCARARFHLEAAVKAGTSIPPSFARAMDSRCPLFPAAARLSVPLLLVLGLIGLFYAAWIALAQRDIKRLVAYSSIGHLGMVVSESPFGIRSPSREPPCK